jgi:hypothetical protein
MQPNPSLYSINRLHYSINPTRAIISLAFVSPKMRTFTIVAAFLAATFVHAAPPQCDTELCGSSFKSIDQRSDSSQFNSRHLTNAQRLARGLGPAPPKRRDGELSPSSISCRQTIKIKSSSAEKRATPSQGMKRATPSQAPPTTIRGMIKVINTNGGAVLGYISKNSLNLAQYRYEDMSNALIVDVTVPTGTTLATDVDFVVEVCFYQEFSACSQANPQRQFRILTFLTSPSLA